MAAEAAPYLHEYFQVVKEHTTKAQEQNMSLMFDPKVRLEAVQEKAAELKAEMIEKTTPILERSFDHHDTKKNGVLDAEEAAVFFSHLVAEQGEFLNVTGALTIKKAIDQMLPMINSMPVEDADREAFKAEMEVQSKDAIDMITAKMNDAAEEYKANKAERDAAMFKVIDVNGDGTLQKGEFTSVFSDEAKMKEMVKTMGFDSDKIGAEAMQTMQAKMQAKMQEGCRPQ